MKSNGIFSNLKFSHRERFKWWSVHFSSGTKNPKMHDTMFLNEYIFDIKYPELFNLVFRNYFFVKPIKILHDHSAAGGQLLWIWYLSLHCQSKFQSYLMESFLPWNFPIAKGSSGDLSTFPSSSTSTKYCTDDSRGNCPGSQDLPLGQAQFFFQKAIVSLCTICAAPLTSSQVAWTISEIFVSHTF